jgi:hypothetical protein
MASMSGVSAFEHPQKHDATNTTPMIATSVQNSRFVGLLSLMVTAV